MIPRLTHVVLKYLLGRLKACANYKRNSSDRKNGRTFTSTLPAQFEFKCVVVLLRILNYFILIY